MNNDEVNDKDEVNDIIECFSKVSAAADGYSFRTIAVVISNVVIAMAGDNRHGVPPLEIIQKFRDLFEDVVSAFTKEMANDKDN